MLAELNLSLLSFSGVLRTEFRNEVKIYWLEEWGNWMDLPRAAFSPKSNRLNSILCSLSIFPDTPGISLHFAPYKCVQFSRLNYLHPHNARNMLSAFNVQISSTIQRVNLFRNGKRPMCAQYHLQQHQMHCGWIQWMYERLYTATTNAKNKSVYFYTYWNDSRAKYK